MNNRKSYRRYNCKTNNNTTSKIPPDRNKIIEAFESDNYDELKKLVSRYDIIDVKYSMLVYCIDNNDEELLIKLVNKHKDYEFLDDCGYYQDKIGSCKNKVIIDKLFEIDKINFDKIEFLTHKAIQHDNIYIINKLQNIGYELDYGDLASVLFNGTIEYIKSIIHLYDNVQNMFNDQFYNYCGNWYIPMTIEKIKYLISINIDITKYICPIINICLRRNDTEFVIFLHGLGAILISDHITLICKNKNIILLKYFLQQGIICNMDKTNFEYPTYEMIKLLQDYGYNFSDEIIKHILTQVLKYNDDDIEEIQKIFDEFGILDFEKDFPIFEYVIHKNNIEVMKFIINNNIGKLDINKLFVVASCNGHVEMAKLLLDINSNVDYNLAFEGACYFGQRDMVKYLLKYDVALNDNVMWMCVYGYYYDDIGYAKILEKCDMKYDVYCSHMDNYNNTHDSNNINNITILKLLLDLGLNLTIEMFKEIGYIHYDMIFIHNLIDNGCNINNLLKMCVGCRNTPNNMYPIVKYLFDNGGCVDVGDVRDVNMVTFLENYNNGCL